MQKGCKSIGYIGSKPLVSSEVMERERAYKDTMAKHGLPVQAVNEVIMHGDETELVKSFLEKYPDLEMVSFGPTLRGVHSPDERLEIATVDKFWRLLLEVLRTI